MNFYLAQNPKYQLKTTSCNIIGQSMVVYWGAKNFGGGDFIYEAKQNLDKHYIKCSNECCSEDTVTTVFQKALWDMIYSNFETLSFVENPISEEEVKKIFISKDKQSLILRTPEKLEVSNNILTMSFFLEKNQREICFTFNKQNFPDINNEESKDIIISSYLSDGNWSNCFISATEKIWTKKIITQPLKQKMFTKNIDKAHMILEDGQASIHWSNAVEAGTFFITPAPNTPHYFIDTQGKDRQFVMQVVKRLLINVQLTDY